MYRKFYHSSLHLQRYLCKTLHSPFGGKVPSLSLQGLQSACTSNHTKYEELTEQGPPSYPSILVSTRLNQSPIAVEQRIRARILLASSRRVISSAYTALNAGRTTPVCVPSNTFVSGGTVFMNESTPFSMTSAIWDVSQGNSLFAATHASFELSGNIGTTGPSQEFTTRRRSHDSRPGHRGGGNSHPIG